LRVRFGTLDGRAVMLNMKICKQCINSRYQVAGPKWNKIDDDLWVRGLMNCPDRPDDVNVTVNGEPPIECRYRIEQLMKAQPC
jgi:hypothetical protein